MNLTQRQEAYDRQRGRCAFCRAWLGDEAHLHHRQMRSQGGADTPENLVLIHPACHDWTHRHPQAAYERGWLVPSWADPAEVPVVTRPLAEA